MMIEPACNKGIYQTDTPTANSDNFKLHQLLSLTPYVCQELGAIGVHTSLIASSTSQSRAGQSTVDFSRTAVFSTIFSL